MSKPHLQIATKTCNAKQLNGAFSESKSLPKPQEGPAHSRIRSLQSAPATGYVSWNQSHLVEDEPTGTGRQPCAPPVQSLPRDIYRGIRAEPEQTRCRVTLFLRSGESTLATRFIVES